MRRALISAVVVALVATAGIALLRAGGGYSLQVVMPEATNLVKGSAVEIGGAKVGKVTNLAVKDGQAVVTATVDSAHAPLHDGTTAVISYKALLGERILDLQPGSAKNAKLRSGALVEGTVDRVELDQVLAMLDAPTRKRLQSLLSELSTTLGGNEDNVRATIQSLGPAAQELGQVLQAVGEDGPAIRQLVTRLNAVTTTMADHSAQVGGTVNDLDTLVGKVNQNRAQLQQALKDLPGTLNVAKTTLAHVPGTVDKARPLLRDLAPGVSELPTVSKHLAPVLEDLRPTVHDLRPTLAAASNLLTYTPGLLDSSNSVLPQVNQVLTNLGPAITYLRPYTPELAGWLANWGSLAGNYDADGHYARAFVEEGTTSATVTPGLLLPPGVTQDSHRLPGANEGQPWTDANGSEMQ